MANNNKPTFHVAMFPWFAMGHLIPFLRFSNELAARGHRVSFLVPTKTQARLKPLNHFPHLISFVPLEVPHVDGIPFGAETMSDVPFALGPLLATAFDQMKNQIEFIMHSLKPRFVFHDFSYWLPLYARQLGIKSVMFMVVGPTGNGFLPMNYVVEEGKVTEKELLHPPPGYPSSSFRLPRFMFQIASQLFNEFGINITFYERLVTSMKESDAITYKTCREVEGPFCDYLQRRLKKPVLLSGPILPEPSTTSTELEERWVEWLGGFKEGSVVYCAFGSECKLEKNQFQELILGLELTDLPFLAALKPPFGAETIEEALPEGFKERVGGRGVVHGGWVQQELILEHPSVGCFVSHCGYGSMWESLVSKCQLVLVPQIPDQFLNAQLLSQELKIAVEVERREEDGWFTRENVCKAVKLVMEEESQVRNELKVNHAKWKSVLTKAGFASSYMDSFLVNLENL